MMEETFLGSDLDLGKLELRSIKVDAVHRMDEASLIKTRWFDYSRLHPAQATYLYADLYKKQTKIFCESYIDIHSAAEARAFVPDDIFMSRDMTSMWLARGAADALGAPYGFVLQFAQARALDRTFKCFPRPNQLYGEEFEIDLAVAWRERLAMTLTFSKKARFQVANYVGSVIQKRHIEFVVDQIKKRPKPHHNLIARTFVEGILNPSLAGDHFDGAEIDKACAVACIPA